MLEIETQLAGAFTTYGWNDVGVVVAVSGGADSVALLRGMASARSTLAGSGRLIVAHFNHGLRGAESDADQAFVEELAARFQLQCCSARAAPAGSGHVAEEAARNQRYAFLLQTASTQGARVVATAHTADDQIETVLHRVVRGSGLSGLAGIPFTRSLSEAVALVRPLLHYRRAEILAYLTARR